METGKVNYASIISRVEKEIVEQQERVMNYQSTASRKRLKLLKNSLIRWKKEYKEYKFKNKINE